MKRPILTLLAAALCSLSISAQTLVKGDMNNDGLVNVGDLTQVVNTINGKLALQTLNLDPYQTDNSRIVGTWWKSKTETISFRADGTTDFTGSVTYEYRPNLGKVLLFDANGKPVSILEILKATDSELIMCPYGQNAPAIYTSTVPVVKVQHIQLSDTVLNVTAETTTLALTATVLPADADDKTVSWSSSDPDVIYASKAGKFVITGPGSCILTCTAQDGSGVSATCRVTVTEETPTPDPDPEPTTHAYVDLGLPSGTLWATCNIGASKPEDYGDYFAWGETSPQSDNAYYWSTYKWCNGSSTTQTKYCTSSSYGTVDDKAELESADDAATANWGADWQMPSLDQIKELYNSSNTTTTWTTQNGVKGRLITSKTNGNTLFLPAAGYRYNSSLIGAGSSGGSWSRTLNSADPDSAYYLYFSSGIVGWNSLGRYDGRSVRAVRVLE